MRGKVGNKLTIYGDWLYDWANIPINNWLFELTYMLILFLIDEK